MKSTVTIDLSPPIQFAGLTLPVNWISITILVLTLAGVLAVMFVKTWNKLIVGFAVLSAGILALIIYALIAGK